MWQRKIRKPSAASPKLRLPKDIAKDWEPSNEDEGDTTSDDDSAGISSSKRAKVVPPQRFDAEEEEEEPAKMQWKCYGVVVSASASHRRTMISPPSSPESTHSETEDGIELNQKEIAEKTSGNQSQLVSEIGTRVLSVQAPPLERPRRPHISRLFEVGSGEASLQQQQFLKEAFENGRCLVPQLNFACMRLMDYINNMTVDNLGTFLTFYLKREVLMELYTMHLISAMVPPSDEDATQSLSDAWDLPDDSDGKNQTFLGKNWKQMIVERLIQFLKQIVAPQLVDHVGRIAVEIRHRIRETPNFWRQVVPRFHIDGSIEGGKHLITSVRGEPFYPRSKRDKANILYRLSRSPWTKEGGYENVFDRIGREPSLLLWALVTEEDVHRLQLLRTDVGEGKPVRVRRNRFGLKPQRFRNAQNLIEWRSLLFYQMLSIISESRALDDIHESLVGRCRWALRRLESGPGITIGTIIDDVFLRKLGPEVMVLVARIEKAYDSPDAAEGKSSSTAASMLNVINQVYHCTKFHRLKYVRSNPALLGTILSMQSLREESKSRFDLSFFCGDDC